MVPAESNSSLLKSRVFRGKLETSPLERRSPPLDGGAFVAFWLTTANSRRPDMTKASVRLLPSGTSIWLAAFQVPSRVITETSYFPETISGNTKLPAVDVLAVYAGPRPVELSL